MVNPFNINCTYRIQLSRIGLFVFISSVLLSGCSEDNLGKDVKRKYSLVWEDDFDGIEGSSPDDTKWTYDIGTGFDGGWGNNELQYYTDRTENVTMTGDGFLEITALKENYLSRSYTSARIKTQGIFDQTYGRIEARIKTPFGQGLWPAFWMLGSDIESVGWPQCGEIDIMELIGNQPRVVHGTVHGPGYSGGNAVSKSFTAQEGRRFDTEFHVFAVEWGEDFIDYFVDDNLYHSVTPEDTPGTWVFDDDFFLILNVAVGGNWPGSPTSTTPFPQKMVVDYIRVYNEIE